VWDAITGKEIRTFPNKYMMSALCFHPKDDVLAGATGDRSAVDFRGELKLWQIGTGRELETYRGPGGSILDVDFHPSGLFLALSTQRQLGGGHVQIRWLTEEVTQELHGHTSPVNSVCFSSDGKLLLTSSLDHTVRVWERWLTQEYRDVPL